MTQAAMFAIPEPQTPQAPKRTAPTPTRKPAVPFGSPDKSGRFWYERYHDELRDLPEEQRLTLLEMLLEWPSERTDRVRVLLDRWTKANGLERDNFMEAYGK